MMPCLWRGGDVRGQLSNSSYSLFSMYISDHILSISSKYHVSGWWLHP
jgi:hypothetical protein